MSKRNSVHPSTAAKMKKLREHLGYSPSEMAGRIGVSSGGYTKYENGIRSPNYTTLTRMVKEFNISMDWFYFNKGPMFYEGEKKIALEQENEGLKEELRQSRQQVENLETQLINKNQEIEAGKTELKNREQELAALPDMTPEVKELAKQMAMDQLLNHEILAYFLRYKRGEKRGAGE